MKQLLLIFTLVITLATACSKSHDALLQAPAKTEYFSRVQFFKDGRKPATDTVWTLTLTSASQLQTYGPLNGYIYNETSTFVDKGVLWSK